MRKRSILLIVLLVFLSFTIVLDFVSDNQPLPTKPMQIKIGDVVELNYTMWIETEIKENNTAGKVYVDHVPVNATIPIDVVIVFPDIKLIPNEGFLKIILGAEQNATVSGIVSIADGYHEGEYAYQELYYTIHIITIYEQVPEATSASLMVFIQIAIALVILISIYEIYDRRASISSPIQTKCKICETEVAVLDCKHCQMVYCRGCLKHNCACGSNRFGHI